MYNIFWQILSEYSWILLHRYFEYLQIKIYTLENFTIL